MGHESLIIDILKISLVQFYQDPPAVKGDWEKIKFLRVFEVSTP